jgi:hypothetical protein
MLLNPLVENPPLFQVCLQLEFNYYYKWKSLFQLQLFFLVLLTTKVDKYKLKMKL